MHDIKKIVNQQGFIFVLSHSMMAKEVRSVNKVYLH